MFSRSADLYDLIYAFKDYPAEVERVDALLKRERPGASSVLDVACGTGAHARLLAERYRVDGLDIEEAFVAIARKKLPHGEVFRADMSDFSLGRTYDVLLCLFSSIGYLLEWERLVGALRCFGRHLGSGGLIMVEPWFTPEDWRVGTMHMQTGEADEVKVCRMSVSQREGDVSVLDFHYLVARAGGVEHFLEHHRLALRTVDEMRAAFREADLAVRYLPDGITGRGIYLARNA
jgi:SAM-dependent methyltransferase